MSKPILYYDASCPVCTQFKKLIAQKTNGKIEFKDAGAKSKKFKYVDRDQLIHLGSGALRRLLHDFPEISGALAILPESWRFQVTNQIVQMAGAMRTLTAKVKGRKDCNCGKKLGR